MNTWTSNGAIEARKEIIAKVGGLRLAVSDALGNEYYVRIPKKEARRLVETGKFGIAGSDDGAIVFAMPKAVL